MHNQNTPAPLNSNNNISTPSEQSLNMASLPDKHSQPRRLSIPTQRDDVQSHATHGKFTQKTPTQRTPTHLAIQNQYNRLRNLQHRISKLQQPTVVPSGENGLLIESTSKRELEEDEGRGNERNEEVIGGKVAIDHKIPILDMQILQIQIGIVGRLEELFDETEHANQVGEDSSNTKNLHETDTKPEIERELRAVVLEWKAVFGGDLDDDDDDEDHEKTEEEEMEVERRMEMVRERLNGVVERWLGGWEVEEMNVPGGGSVVIEVHMG